MHAPLADSPIKIAKPHTTPNERPNPLFRKLMTSSFWKSQHAKETVKPRL